MSAKASAITTLEAAVEETNATAAAAAESATAAAADTLEAHSSEIASLQAAIDDASIAAEQSEQTHNSTVGAMQTQIEQLTEARASSAEGADVLEAQCAELAATNAALEVDVSAKASAITTLEAAVEETNAAAAAAAEQHGQEALRKQAEIDSLNQEHSNVIAEKTSAFDALVAANNAEKARSAAAESECAKLSDQCNELEAFVANCNAEIMALSATNENAASDAVLQSEQHGTALAVKQSELEAAMTKLETTSSKLQELQAEVDQFEQAGATLRGSVADMQKKDAVHAKEVQVLRQNLVDVSSAKDDVSNELESSKRAVETKSAMLDDMKSGTTSLNGTIQTMKDDKETERIAHEEELRSLAATIQAKDDETEMLAGSNEALEQANSDLKDMVDKMEASNVLADSERKSFERQSKDIITLTQELSAEKERNRNIFAQTATKLEAANEKVSFLELQNKKIAEEIEVVEKESEAKVTQALQNAQTEIEALAAENKVLQEKSEGGGDSSSATAAARSASPFAEAAREAFERRELLTAAELKNARAAVAALEMQVATQNSEMETLEDRLCDAIEKSEGAPGDGSGRATPKLAGGRITPHSKAELEDQQLLVQEHREMISKLQDACERKADANEQLTVQLREAKARADGASSRLNDDGAVDELQTQLRHERSEVGRLKMENIALQAKAKDHESFVRTMQVDGKIAPGKSTSALAKGALANHAAKKGSAVTSAAVIRATGATAGGNAKAVSAVTAVAAEEEAVGKLVRPRSPTKEVVDIAVMSPAPKAAKRTTRLAARGLANQQKALDAAEAKVNSLLSTAAAQQEPEAVQDENVAPPVMQATEDAVPPSALAPAKKTGRKKSALALAKEKNAAMRQSNRSLPKRVVGSKPAAKATKAARKVTSARGATLAAAATADEEEPAECATQ